MDNSDTMASAGVSSGKGCIAVLVGVPGSGKTTLANALCQSDTAAFTASEASSVHQRTVISFDDIVPLDEQKKAALEAAASSADTSKPAESTTAGGDSSHQAEEEEGKSRRWKKYRQQMMERVRETYERQKSVNAAASVIFIDDNNYYASMRYEYYQLARDLKVGFCQFHLSVGDSVDWALEVNSQRAEKERVPDTVVSQMFERLEPPRPLANAWESMSFTLDAKSLRNSSSGVGADPTAAQQTIQICQQIIQAAIDNPVTKAEVPEHRSEAARQESRSVCSKSLLHQVDKSLRRVLGDKIRAAMRGEREDMPTFGRKLNALRTELLSDIKQGDKPEFRIPDDVAEAVKSSATDASLSSSSVDSQLDLMVNKMFDLKMKEQE